MGALDAFVPPEPSVDRRAVLTILTQRIADLPTGRRIVAVDGVDGAGKSVLARELTAFLAPIREAHRASIDGFHHPRAERYARGVTARTYYEDSFDYRRFRGALVDPFRDGDRFVTAVFDSETDSEVTSMPHIAGPNAVLIVDGIFLHRPELLGLWDASIWVDVPFEVSVPRGNARFGEVGAQEADPTSTVNARWVGGQQLYLAQAQPARAATWVLNNRDLDRPRLSSLEP
ncbi:MAG: uridine kinase [Phycicoccus sp.]|nr:uridine kinase [Phycicoccus sp.]